MFIIPVAVNVARHQVITLSYASCTSSWNFQNLYNLVNCVQICLQFVLCCHFVWACAIYIAPDLSPKQRETNKVLVAEFKRRKDNGEQIKIRNGKIVKFNELPPDGADARHRSNSLASDN